MTVRNVLVLGDSPHAAELLEQLDRDPDSQRQSASSELPDLAILAGAEEADLAVAMSLLENVVRRVTSATWPSENSARTASRCHVAGAFSTRRAGVTVSDFSVTGRASSRSPSACQPRITFAKSLPGANRRPPT